MSLVHLFSRITIDIHPQKENLQAWRRLEVFSHSFEALPRYAGYPGSHSDMLDVPLTEWGVHMSNSGSSKQLLLREVVV